MDEIIQRCRLHTPNAYKAKLVTCVGSKTDTFAMEEQQWHLQFLKLRLCSTPACQIPHTRPQQTTLACSWHMVAASHASLCTWFCSTTMVQSLCARGHSLTKVMRLGLVQNAYNAAAAFLVPQPLTIASMAPSSALDVTIIVCPSRVCLHLHV